jgi:hypothetical protein
MNRGTTATLIRLYRPVDPEAVPGSEGGVYGPSSHLDFSHNDIALFAMYYAGVFAPWQKLLVTIYIRNQVERLLICVR